MTDHYIAYLESTNRALAAANAHQNQLIAALRAELHNGHHCEACLAQTLTDLIEGASK